MKKDEFHYIIVESFIPDNLSGKKGLIHMRPIPNQEPFLTSMYVACSRNLTYGYPLGTKFRIKAKITQCDGTLFIYTHYKWSYEVYGL
jgi:hypothetical protein